MTDDSPKRDPQSAGSRFFVRLFGESWRALPLALIGWLLVVGFMLFPLVRPAVHVGPDSHYHTAVGERMAERGPFFRDFPWVTESIWVERYFDKEWLFHLALAPVASWDAVAGPKLLILLICLAMGGAYWALAHAAGVRRPLFWTLALPLAAGGFLVFRYALVRPHVLSYVWLFALLAALLHRRRWLLAVITVLYALSHASHWIVPGLVLLYDVAYALLDDDGKRRDKLAWRQALLPWALGGFALGTLIHPQFPNNISGLWVQNVEVLTGYWSQAADLEGLRPRELQPLGLQLFALVLPLTIATPLVLGWAWKSGLRPTRTLWLVLAYTAGFGVLALSSLRFIDYVTPLWLLSLALVVQQAPLPSFRGDRALAILAIGACLLWAGRGYMDLWQRYPVAVSQKWNGHSPHYLTAEYIRDNTQPGDVVYTAAWDLPPYLWQQAPAQHYLVFLDPVFMYRRDPERFRLWKQLNSGELPNAAQQIREVFGARVIVLDVRLHRRLAAQLDATPGVTRIHQHEEDLLYAITAAPGPAPAAIAVGEQ